VKHLAEKTLSLCKTAAGLFLLAGIFVLPGSAQEEEPLVDKRGYRRVSVGFRAGGNAMDHFSISDRTFDRLAGPPALFVASEGASNTGRIFYGGMVQVNPNNKWAVEIDFLTRKADYGLDITVDTQSTEDDPAEFVERTIDVVNFRYLDVPILVKRYFGNPDKARAYFSGGIALRNIMSDEGQRTTILPEDLIPNDDNVIDATGRTESISPNFANSNPIGGVFAIGIEGTDDFGVRVSLEARATRWMQNAVDLGFVRSNATQLEIMVGITF